MFTFRRRQRPTEQFGSAYAYTQLMQALETSGEKSVANREDSTRIRKWHDVLSGMASGDLTVGSRRPVSELPEWVTLEVVRGGFATGRAIAEVPVGPEEAAGVGLKTASRSELFAALTSDAGLDDLLAAVESGAYQIEVPEDAALPMVAWLIGHGHPAEAIDVLAAIAPLRGRLRLSPVPETAEAVPDRGRGVYRFTVAEVRSALDLRKPSEPVEKQREALSVWNPFADKLLALWSSRDSTSLVRAPDEDFIAQAEAVVREFAGLSRQHALTSRRRKAHSNLSVLVAATRVAAQGKPLTTSAANLVRLRTSEMIRKRGFPGSETHAAIRADQFRVAATPSVATFSRLVSDRLAFLPQSIGAVEPERSLTPVTPAESAFYELPLGATPPHLISQIARRARSGELIDLLRSGTVPSAEVMAELVPQLTADAVGSAYVSPDLGALVGQTYEAFRRRRSLLLLNLERQVQFEELPWIDAVSGLRSTKDPASLELLHHVGKLALDIFSGSALPNALVAESKRLAFESGLKLPWVDELAADIFMGEFSATFAAASALARSQLKGSLYARYYELDSKPVPDDEAEKQFTLLCFHRAGMAPGPRRGVAANGMVIEQAQILTTHNLASLYEAGVRPTSARESALNAWRTVIRELERASQSPRPLRRIKNAAYAWRQVLFFLSVSDDLVDASDFLTVATTISRDAAGPSVAEVTEIILDGLRTTVWPAIARRTDDSKPQVKQFLGWSIEDHWALAILRP